MEEKRRVRGREDRKREKEGKQGREAEERGRDGGTVKGRDKGVIKESCSDCFGLDSLKRVRTRGKEREN